jgi:hypothetical protein
VFIGSPLLVAIVHSESVPVARICPISGISHHRRQAQSEMHFRHANFED